MQLGNLPPERVEDDSDEGKAYLQEFVRARASRLDFDPEAYDISVSAEGTVTAYRKAHDDIPDIKLDMPDDDGENRHERDERHADEKARTVEDD